MLDPVTFFTGFPLAPHTVAHRCQPWRSHSGLYVEMYTTGPSRWWVTCTVPPSFLPGSLSMPHLRGAWSSRLRAGC